MNKLNQNEIIKLSKINHHIKNIIKNQCKIEGEINNYDEAKEIMSIFKFTGLGGYYEMHISDKELITMKELTELNLKCNRRITDEDIKGLINLESLHLGTPKMYKTI